MTVTLDLTEDQTMTALRAFLVDVLGSSVDVIAGQDNRVPEPALPNFIVMTPLLRGRLNTNVHTWDTTNPDPVTLTARRATQFTVQLDVHGPAAGDNTQIVGTLFRDPYGVAAFPAGIAPLWADEGQQAPFINGENQYENRWTMNVVLQVNPAVSTPQQFADTLTIANINQVKG